MSDNKSKQKTLQICKFLSDKKAYGIVYIDNLKHK